MREDDGESRAVGVATITALIVVAAFVAGKAARDAILLSSFNIKTLPIFIGVSALISLPVILVAGKLMARFGPARLMPALNLASAGFAVVEWGLLGRYPRPIAVAVFFHLSTSGAVLVSGFWSTINERFDVQTAKRHMGRIGMGATLGGILGGLIAEATAIYLSSDEILLVLAALQLTSATMLFLFGSKSRHEPIASPSEGAWVALRVVTRSRLLRNVGGVVVLGAAAAGILDYVFKADIVASSSKHGLLGSLAAFYTVTSVLTAIVQVAFCGPVIAWLGVPRSISTLPLSVTAFALTALAVPAAFAATIARAAELITRNSIYRAGYELLYAPLPESDKRPTKVVLDVGAERIGDLLGAQLVGLIVYLMVAPRASLLVATVVTGAVAAVFAMWLPGSYTAALEASLLARGADPAPHGPASDAQSEPWLTLGSSPILGQAGDPSPLRFRERGLRRRRAPAAPPTPAQQHTMSATLTELQAPNPERIKRALAGELTPELAIHVIGLVGRDDVAREAISALRRVAPRCTGMFVDGLLDQTRDVIVRRRLAEVLAAGEPQLATWGLWRGLVDPSFEVRYRCGVVLARLGGLGHLAHLTAEDVYETVRRELGADHEGWKNQRVIDDLVVAAAREDGEHDDVAHGHSGSALEHVFTVLGLVLPAEPLRIALRAVQTDDSALRGTALEYLESILPADVRAQLWPLLETAETATQAGAEASAASAPDLAAAAAPPAPPARSPRSKDELVAALKVAFPALKAKLHKPG